jgi:hypothetical protein
MCLLCRAVFPTHGTEVMPDTNFAYTHCQMTHCTEFAGGFIVLPAQINFDNVWANASVYKNPIVYATLFTIIGLYIVLGVICRIFDMRDAKKKGVTMLNENRMDNLYEVIVFTGHKRGAWTDSNVNINPRGLIKNVNQTLSIIKLQGIFANQQGRC